MATVVLVRLSVVKHVLTLQIKFVSNVLIRNMLSLTEEFVDVSTIKNLIRTGLCQTFSESAAIVMSMVVFHVPLIPLSATNVRMKMHLLLMENVCAQKISQ